MIDERLKSVQATVIKESEVVSELLGQGFIVNLNYESGAAIQ